MVICSAGHHAESVRLKCGGEHLRILERALHVASELGFQREREGDRLCTNDVHQWAALAPWEDALINGGAVCAATKGDPATRTAEGLMCGARDNICVRERRGVQPRRNDA